MPVCGRKRKVRGGLFRTQCVTEPAIIVQEINDEYQDNLFIHKRTNKEELRNLILLQ